MNNTKDDAPPLAAPTGWALLTTPLRIVLAILVFAPVSLALKATAKLGEFLSEAGADLDWRWTKLAQDTVFLLHGKSLETAQQNAKELKDLRARWKFFHGDEDKPNVGGERPMEAK